MMKKTPAVILLAALLALSACAEGGSGDEAGVREVYYLAEGENGRELDCEVVSFDEGLTEEEDIRAAIEAMRSPLNENHKTLLGDGMGLEDVQIFGGTVVVRFSEGYDELSDIERSLLDSAVTLTLVEIDGISYVRVTGPEASPAVFRGASSVLLNDEDLRLSSYEIEIFPVDREKNALFSYQLRILTEEDEITPAMIMGEMINGQLGVAAPFDGRMDARMVSAPNDAGQVRAELYVPVEMELAGREADIYSIVNSLCSCRGVSSVTITINGRAPSERGLEGCDGPLRPDGSYMDGGRGVE